MTQKALQDAANITLLVSFAAIVLCSIAVDSAAPLFAWVSIGFLFLFASAVHAKPDDKEPPK